MNEPNPPGAAIDGWSRAAAGLLLAVIAIVLLTFEDYGITWDAQYHTEYSKHLLAWWTSGFTDRGALTYHNLYLYGGAFDLLVALANAVSPLGEYETSHLVNALVGVLGIAGAWRLAHHIGGPRAAFFAALALLLDPSWYGHMFNNPKDIPFAVALIWVLCHAARACAELPAVSWRTAVKLGLTLGIALGIRVGGVIVLIYLALAFAAHAALRIERAGFAATLGEARAAVPRLAAAGAIAYAAMVLLWPWAQQNPLVNPLRALLLFSHIEWDLNVLFEGRLVNSMRLPADYLAVYFGVKLPALILLLLLSAPLVWLFWRRSRGGASAADALSPVAVLLVAAIVFPFVYFVLARPVTYDAIRHFLFVLPPMAVAAGLTIDRLVDLAATWRRPLRSALAGSLGLYGAYHVAVMVQLHPDEYVYYNEIAGGVDGAKNRFELDYWGNSYAEAVEKLSEYLAREEGIAGTPVTYRVAVCSSGISASYFFPPNLDWTGDDESADFYISVTRLGCDKELEGVEILRVERDGATLSVVKDRRSLRAKGLLALKRHGGVASRRHPALADP